MNVLVIFSDQQHKYALGCVDPQFITPNLDALAEDGVLFRNGYSNNPVCGPFRGCLMTGQYTSHNHVYDNCWALPEGTPTIAQQMNAAGYETTYVGKWHLGGNGSGPIPEEIRGGFQHFIGYQCYNGFDPRPPFNNRVSFFDEQNQEHVYNAHRTDVTTDLAIERLKQVAGGEKPFFMMVSYQAPHYPEQPGDEYAQLYKDTVFADHPGDEPVDPYTPTFSPFSPRPFENCPDYQRYGGDMTKYRQLYAGLVSQVDAGVGRIVDTLKQLGCYEDTLIVYTSDHGDMQGSHGLKNKCYPHEKSAGVPFIARVPNGIKGVVSDELVSGVDIFPTALEAAGAPVIDGLDGHSFLSYLQNGKGSVNDYIISEYVLGKQPWRMIRTPQYKLTVSMTSYEPISLYDMTADPYELNDLHEDASHAAVITRLRKKLMENTEEVGDTSATPEQRAKWYPQAASLTGNS